MRDAAHCCPGQIIGGAIAARFAAAHGDRLRCLVLSDALGLSSFRPAPEFAEALMAFVIESSAENHDLLLAALRLRPRYAARSHGRELGRLRAYNLDRARVTGLKPAQQSMVEQFGLPAIPPEDLTRIRVPTVLIWGRHDLVTPLSIAEAASLRYGWPLHVIDRAADDPPIEQPAAFVEELRAALSAAGSAAFRTQSDTWDAWGPNCSGLLTAPIPKRRCGSPMKVCAGRGFAPGCASSHCVRQRRAQHPGGADWSPGGRHRPVARHAPPAARARPQGRSRD